MKKTDYNEEDLCFDCEEPAEWACVTQFAGDHLFCTKHAELDDRWGDEGGSYFFWKRLDA